ncbi:uncharacterized protein LOC136086196 [Hydra vulgaris]|uniref:Uncharacterized protein LOC136086196 n=1 Tax=Hydra vulgaris TaxID=6087 RepID=A0ABM4CRP4_HYDVU
MAWILRIIINLKSKRKCRVLLSVIDRYNEMQKLIKIPQYEFEKPEQYKETSERLRLHINHNGLLVCMDCIQGEHPIFLPRKHPFTNLVIQRAHAQTHHGMVGLTMSRCKPLLAPLTADLPKYRTKSKYPFETIGLDFAGPIEYKVNKECYKKSYIVLYTCATSRAIHLDLLKTMENEDFRRSIKEMIARRGTPALIISDNAKTFVSTARWLRRLQRDPLINNHLGEMNIKWKFNLARSPWWGGFFERMAGLVKRSLHKAAGRIRLTFERLKEVLIDIENTLNNRPLRYIENNI